MFPVSLAYLAAVSQKTRTWNIFVDVQLSTGEQLTLTHKHLANKPFTFTEGATCTSTLHIGSTFSNSVEFTVLDVEHDFAGALVRPRVGLLLESGDFEYVPLGDFSVVDLSRQTMSTVLYCYDGMSTMNRVFDVHLITYPATVLSVVHAACDQAGVRMSPNLEAELQTLDTPVHSLEKVECTCRDIVASAGVLLCKSMRFNREGLLESFWYSSVDRDTTAATRVKTSKYEDRTVRVTGVVLGDPFNQKYQYGSSDYTVELLRNPFLQDYSYVVNLAPKVLAALQRVVYKPSTVYYIGDPALQAGDIVQHNLGAKGVLASPIMKMIYVYRGTSTLEAVGVSAAQLKQHSSVDKQVVAVQQQSNRYVDQALASQTQEDIFNKLTNNGKDSGIFLVDHRILINADYIGAGSLSADIIRAGKIRSTDFAVQELQQLYPAADDVHEASGEIIALSDAFNSPFKALTLYGKTTQNGTPTPESPVDLESVGDDGSVAVTVCGKNLLPKFSSIKGTGYSITAAEDGTLTVNSDSSLTASVYIGPNDIIKLPAGTYILSGSPVGSIVGNCDIGIQKPGEDGALISIARSAGGNEETFTLEEETTLTAWVRCGRGYANNNVIIKPMIRSASIADNTYEPYKTGQTMTAQTPNGLPGIPVSSGGNYTDENGQQWICDEIDFARGKYVQRVGRKTVTSDDNTRVPYNAVSGIVRTTFHLNNGMKVNAQERIGIMCNKLPGILGYNQEVYGGTGVCLTGNGAIGIGFGDIYDIETFNTRLAEVLPLDVLYLLATPIETDLTAEEIAQYAALHTNYPNTTVYNDDMAGMAVRYVDHSGGFIYPSNSLYPNNGEQIIRGFEIDFESGVIRGVFWSDAIAALEDRVLTLETQLSYTEKAVSDLQAENAELQANVSELENEVAVHQRVISTLEAQITALQIAGQERDSRLTKLETSLVYPKSAT